VTIPLVSLAVALGRRFIARDTHEAAVLTRETAL